MCEPGRGVGFLFHLGCTCLHGFQSVHEMDGIHKLLSRELFITDSVSAGMAEGCQVKGEAIVTGFGDIPQVIIERQLFQGCRL